MILGSWAAAVRTLPRAGGPATATASRTGLSKQAGHISSSSMMDTSPAKYVQLNKRAQGYRESKCRGPMRPRGPRRPLWPVLAISVASSALTALEVAVGGATTRSRKRCRRWTAEPHARLCHSQAASLKFGRGPLLRGAFTDVEPARTCRVPASPAGLQHRRGGASSASALCCTSRFTDVIAALPRCPARAYVIECGWPGRASRSPPPQDRPRGADGGHLLLRLCPGDCGSSACIDRHSRSQVLPASMASCASIPTAASPRGALRENSRPRGTERRMSGCTNPYCRELDRHVASREPPSREAAHRGAGIGVVSYSPCAPWAMRARSCPWHTRPSQSPSN